jgi:hypothetical protein
LPNAQGTGQSNSGIFQTENQISASSAGQRLTSNTFLIDGVSVDSLSHGGAAIITPNPESVAQVTNTSSAFDATLGRNVGLQVRTVTKSGTNNIHGSLFFQYDEPGLNAYQPYGGPAGALPIRVENKQREYAASLGFPILKDKLFLFASYEGASNLNAGFSEQYVPTPQYLSTLAQARSTGIVNGVLNGPGGAPSVISLLPTLCQNLQSTPGTCTQLSGGADIGSFSGARGTYLPAYNSATPHAANALTGGGLDGIPDVEFAQVKNSLHLSRQSMERPHRLARQRSRSICPQRFLHQACPDQSRRHHRRAAPLRSPIQAADLLRHLYLYPHLQRKPDQRSARQLHPLL